MRVVLPIQSADSKANLFQKHTQSPRKSIILSDAFFSPVQQITWRNHDARYRILGDQFIVFHIVSDEKFIITFIFSSVSDVFKNVF